MKKKEKCIFNRNKICTNCIEKAKPFSKRPYDLCDELKMGTGYKLIRGYNLLREED